MEISPEDLYMDTGVVTLSKMVQILESRKIHTCLWCDHSVETSLAVLFHGTVQCAICFPVFYKVKCGHFDEF